MRDYRFEQKNYIVLNIILIFVLCLSISVATLYKIDNDKKNFKPDSIASSDIIANSKIIDDNKTQEKYLNIRKSVEPVYYIDDQIRNNIFVDLKEYFAKIRALYNSDKPLPEKIDLLEKSSFLNFSKVDLVKILKLNMKEVDRIERTVEDYIKEVYKNGIKENEVNSLKESINKDIKNSKLSFTCQNMAYNFIEKSLQANMFINKAATEEKIETQIKDAEPIYYQVGDVLIKKGQYIDRYLYDKAIEANPSIKNKSYSKADIMKILIYLLLLFVFLIYVIVFFSLSYKSYMMSILLFSFIIPVLLSSLLYKYSLMALPVFICTFFIAVFHSRKMSIVSSISFLAYLVHLYNLDLNQIFYYIVTIFAANIFLKQKNRYAFLGSGLIVSFIGLIAYYITSIFFNKEVFANKSDLISLLLNPLLSSLLIAVLCVYVEKIFNILTTRKLNELSDLSSPLLNSILLKAPGTYQHSLMVANISEIVAKKLGLNSLLLRVGAYYHDIGKINYPLYFKENQSKNDNIHDDVDPYFSKEYILNHVKDGIDILKKNNFPQEIINFVKTHHGDSVVYYFYKKAEEKYGINAVNVDDFKYNFGIPQSTEEAVLMIADSCEAAVRSLKTYTTESIGKMVENVINSKIDSGQFRNCEISFKQIEEIRKIVVEVCENIYHSRIEYPK